MSHPSNASRVAVVSLACLLAGGPAPSASWFVDGGASGALFGRCVASAGDVNGDGAGDAIVGAYTHVDMHSNEGRVYAFHGTPAVRLPCDADFNDDGLVNGGDLGTLLGAWGECP